MTTRTLEVTPSHASTAHRASSPSIDHLTSPTCSHAPVDASSLPSLTCLCGWVAVLASQAWSTAAYL